MIDSAEKNRKMVDIDNKGLFGRKRMKVIIKFANGRRKRVEGELSKVNENCWGAPHLVSVQNNASYKILS